MSGAQEERVSKNGHKEPSPRMGTKSSNQERAPRTGTESDHQAQVPRMGTKNGERAPRTVTRSGVMKNEHQESGHRERATKDGHQEWRHDWGLPFTLVHLPCSGICGSSSPSWSGSSYVEHSVEHSMEHSTEHSMPGPGPRMCGRSRAP